MHIDQIGLSPRNGRCKGGVEAGMFGTSEEKGMLLCAICE